MTTQWTVTLQVATPEHWDREWVRDVVKALVLDHAKDLTLARQPKVRRTPKGK